MPAVTQRIDNYLGGVSRQSDDKKLPGQVRECLNAYPDPTFGLTKRTGFKWIKNLGTGTTYDGGKWFYIARTADERYIGVITPKPNSGYGGISIWNVDGTVCSVTMDTSTAVNAVNYLTGARTNYSVLTVQDTSVIVNNLQTVAKQPDPNFVANTRATLVLSDTAVSSTYSVTINAGGGASDQTFTTTTGTDTTYDQLLTTLKNGIDAFVNVTNEVNDADLTKLITCWNNGTSVAVTNNPNDVTDTGIKQFDSTNTTHLDAGALATENSAFSFAVFSCDDDVDNPTTSAGATISNVVTIKRPDVSSAVLFTDSACTSAISAGSDNVSIGEELYLKVVGTGGDFGGKCGAVLVNWDSGASDADDKYNRYEFTSSDTTSTNQVTIKHQFSKEGAFAVKVQVEDPRGFRSDKTALTGEPVDVGATAPVAVLKSSKTRVLNAKFADQDSAVLLTGSGSYCCYFIYP